MDFRQLRVPSTEALSVALQHQAVAADQQIICKILQVCKAWRTAVQHSNACITDVIYQKQTTLCISCDSKADFLAEITGFTCWLRSHAGIIRSISISLVGYPFWEEPVRGLRLMAHSELSSCLRAAAAAPSPNEPPVIHTRCVASAISKLSEAADHHGDRFRQDIRPASFIRSSAAAKRAAMTPLWLAAKASPGCFNTSGPIVTPTATAARLSAQQLQLQSFTYHGGLDSPQLLFALPAAKLTHLELTGCSTPQVAEAISSLGYLRSLHIDSGIDWLPEGYLSSVNKLRDLTRLHLCTLELGSELALLPSQLIDLNLSIGGYIRTVEDILNDIPARQQTIDMSHLTHLQKLVVKCYGSIEAAALPQQLQQLGVTCSSPVITAFNVTTLQQLQQVSITDKSRHGVGKLLTLNNMQRLEDIDLQYKFSMHAVSAAPAWVQLEKLAGLTLNLPFCQACSAIDMATIVTAVRKLTGLKKLDFRCEVQGLNAGWPAPEPVMHQHAMRDLSCILQSVGHLNKLVQLRIGLKNWVGLQHNDVLHLSRLTGLTCLRLSLNQEQQVAAVVAVMLELTRLQELALLDPQCCACLLPVVGKLQGLTHLSLNYSSSGTWLPTEMQSGLKFLTRLRNLHELHGFESCGKAALTQSWAAFHST